MSRQQLVHILAVAGALIGWAGLVLQLFVLIQIFRTQGATALQAAWRFLGYFTILSNIAAAIILTHSVTHPQSISGLNGPRFELTTATAIAMVCLVYAVILRALWNPEHWQKLADVILHDITPVLFVVYLVLRGHAFTWRDALYALIPPVAYVLYAFTRGSFDGWYAYHFLDPTRLSAPRLALHMITLLAAFWITALILIALTLLTKQRYTPTQT